MGNFDIAYQFVRKVEGGYSNYKNDRGGETNYGITRNTFEEAKKQGIMVHPQNLWVTSGSGKSPSV